MKQMDMGLRLFDVGMGIFVIIILFTNVKPARSIYVVKSYTFTS